MGRRARMWVSLGIPFVPLLVLLGWVTIARHSRQPRGDERIRSTRPGPQDTHPMLTSQAGPDTMASNAANSVIPNSNAKSQLHVLLKEYSAVSVGSKAAKRKYEEDLARLLSILGKESLYDLVADLRDPATQRAALWVLLAWGDSSQLTADSLRVIEWNESKDERLAGLLEKWCLDTGLDPMPRALALHGARRLPTDRAEKLIRSILELQEADTLRHEALDTADHLIDTRQVGSEFTEFTIKRAFELFGDPASSDATRFEAASLSCRRPEYATRLLLWLNDERSPLVRRAIVIGASDMLQRHPEDEASPALLKHLLAVLPNVGDLNCREHVIASFGDPDVGRNHRDSLAKFLTSTADSQNEEGVRIAAIEALARGRYTDSVPILQRLLGDRTSRVARAAHAALELLNVDGRH